MTSARKNREEIDEIYLPEQLIVAAQSGAKVKLYKYYMPENDEQDALAFFDALTLENCPDEIIINAHSVRKPVDVETILEFVLTLLSSGKCKNGLTLCLYNTYIGDKGVILIANALQNIPQIKGLTLDVRSNNITSEGAIELAETMRLCPGSLANVIIHGNNIGAAGIEAFVTLLQQGLCGPSFQLRFNKIDLEGKDDETAEAILQALLSGNCPVGFELDLRGVNLRHELVLRFAKALASGKLPDGMSLYLGDELFGEKKREIGNDGARAFADALMSGNAPTNLTLGLYDSSIDGEGALAFAPAVKHKNCPRGLRLYLPDVHYLHVHREFSDALISSTSLVELDLNELGWGNNEREGCFIQYACLRNKLMHEYPEYADDIMKMCIEKDFFQSEYKIYDYWTKMKLGMHIESEFPEVDRLGQLPPGLVSGLMWLSNLEYDMAPIKYDVSRHGFFRVKGPDSKVYNSSEYADQLKKPKIPDNLKPLIRFDRY